MMRIELTMFVVAVWQLIYNVAELLAHYCQRMTRNAQVYLIRYQTRQHLRHLSEEQLRDVGLSQEQADAERAKPFWI